MTKLSYPQSGTLNSAQRIPIEAMHRQAGQRVSFVPNGRTIRMMTAQPMFGRVERNEVCTRILQRTARGDQVAGCGRVVGHQTDAATVELIEVVGYQLVDAEVDH